MGMYASINQDHNVTNNLVKTDIIDNTFIKLTFWSQFTSNLVKNGYHITIFKTIAKS